VLIWFHPSLLKASSLRKPQTESRICSNYNQIPKVRVLINVCTQLPRVGLHTSYSQVYFNLHFVQPTKLSSFTTLCAWLHKNLYDILEYTSDIIFHMIYTPDILFAYIWA
jgi:hypothetical protein